MELINVRRYYPDVMPYGDGIQYFQSEDGKDFYESLESFNLKYKLCIEPRTGIIRAIAEDVSTLYPVGFSVVETDSLPEGCDIYGGWQFKDGSISAVIQSQIAWTQQEYKERLMVANEKIAILQDAQDMGIATDDELSQLAAWKRYRVLLNRADPSKTPDATPPEMP